MKSNHKRTPFAEVLNHLDRKYSSFDGTGYQEPYYDYIEGAPEEPVSRIYQADPYQIIVENPDKVVHKAILFGKNKFSSKPNFGSDPEIKITMGQPGVEYVELLEASASAFITQFMRIESDNKLQITKFITINDHNPNGNSNRRSLNMQQFKSTYQNLENMLDAPISEKITGSTYWEIEIEPLTRVFYTIFPLYKVDISEPLVGNEAIKTFAPARVNTAGLILPQQNLLTRR
ncbi:hypothetical protein D3C87_32090 [compost metagenome]